MLPAASPGIPGTEAVTDRYLDVTAGMLERKDGGQLMEHVVELNLDPDDTNRLLHLLEDWGCTEQDLVTAAVVSQLDLWDFERFMSRHQVVGKGTPVGRKLDPEEAERIKEKIRSAIHQSSLPGWFSTPS